jgi:hypothetical protein
MAAHLKEQANRRTRGVCHALRAHEQDLFLTFAALLRLARSSGADADDRAAAAATTAASAAASAASSLAASRRQTGESLRLPMINQQQPLSKTSSHTVVQIRGSAPAEIGGSPTGAAPAADCAAAAVAGGATAVAAKGPLGHDGIVRALCDVIGGWMVHPLGDVCVPAREAASAFLWYIVSEDRGYKCLLQAKQRKGLQKGHSDHSNLPQSPRSPLLATLPRGGRGGGSGLTAAAHAPLLHLKAQACLGAAAAGIKRQTQQQQQQPPRKAELQRRVSGVGSAAAAAAAAGGACGSGTDENPCLEDEGHAGSLRVGRRSGAASAAGAAGASRGLPPRGPSAAAAVAAAAAAAPEMLQPEARRHHSEYRPNQRSHSGGNGGAAGPLPLKASGAGASRGGARRRSTSASGRGGGLSARGANVAAATQAIAGSSQLAPPQHSPSPRGLPAAVPAVAADPSVLSLSAMSELQLLPNSRAAAAAGPRLSQSLEGFSGWVVRLVD